MKHHRLFAALLSSLLLAPLARAENWPQWRGPTFNGASTETNLPTKLDDSTVAWTVELPGRGASTPIIWSDRAFISVQSKDKNLLALCFDTTSGKELWRKDIAVGFQVKNLADLASPSCVTDGKIVVYYFGTGDLAAFDMDGKSLWTRNLQKDHGPFNFQWIYGSSPLLYKNKLYIPVIHRDVPGNQWRDPKPDESLADSYILAIDPASGKDLWKHVRAPDQRSRVEAKESYATIIPYEGKARTELLILGGDVVTAHNPDNGEEYWRGGGWNPRWIDSWRIVPSVVVANDLVIACAPKNGPITAYKPGGTGDITASHIAWRSDEITSDVAVPAVANGNLYVLQGEKKALSCVDPSTGNVKWSQKLDSRPVFRASPTVVDGKVYCINENGDLWVLSAAEPKILFQRSLGTQAKAHATISVANGKIFIRTGDKLYAFANK